MIGVQSSLIMFPVNILIVSVFRNTRPWQPCWGKSNTERRSDALEPTSSTQSAADGNVTFETVVKVSHLFCLFYNKGLGETEREREIFLRLRPCCTDCV